MVRVLYFPSYHFGWFIYVCLASMHDAYEPVPILEKLPLQIDCLAAWGEFCLPLLQLASFRQLLHSRGESLLAPFHWLIITVSQNLVSCRLAVCQHFFSRLHASSVSTETDFIGQYGSSCWIFVGQMYFLWICVTNWEAGQLTQKHAKPMSSLTEHQVLRKHNYSTIWLNNMCFIS